MGRRVGKKDKDNEMKEDKSKTKRRRKHLSKFGFVCISPYIYSTFILLPVFFTAYVCLILCLLVSLPLLICSTSCVLLRVYPLCGSHPVCVPSRISHFVCPTPYVSHSLRVPLRMYSIQWVSHSVCPAVFMSHSVYSTPCMSHSMYVRTTPCMYHSMCVLRQPLYLLILTS